MYDPLTAEIIKRLEKLSISKKRAILELMKSDSEGSFKSKED